MNSQSDLFHPLASLVASEAPVQHPSELQGVICGLLATGLGTEGAELLGVLSAHAELPDGWSAGAAALFGQMRDQAMEAFHGDTLELDLLLPADTAPLAERVDAIGRWCEGFMVGFGTGTAGLKDADLSPSLQEAIADLAAVSQVEAPAVGDEEAERMLGQVVEHCRMAALLVFTELALMRRRQKGDNAERPVRH